jgi:5,6-dimethylbenzimidazole synthase
VLPYVHTLVKVNPSVFDAQFRNRFRELLMWRRDVRHFRSTPIPESTFRELMDLIRLCPSVGLSEPWRFVRVATSEKRTAIRKEFERANAEALSGYGGEQQSLYARLKLAGLEAAPIQLAVFADRSTAKGADLGRRTMPEMIEYSVVSAITTLWLGARTHGIGLGWVSILDPGRVNSIVGAPDTWRLVAYLCLGYPEFETTIPELESAGWETRSTELIITEV